MAEINREKVVSKLDELRQIADTEIHPIVSPDNWDVYSKLCDLIDLAKADILDMLKEQETTFMKDGHHIMCKSCGAYWCDRDREGDQYPQNFCPNCGKAVKLDG